MFTRCLLSASAVCLVCAAPAHAQEPARDVLYRMTLVRAAPGKLLDLVGALKAFVVAVRDAKEAEPLLLRHSQGDHWDLMVLAPITTYGAYFVGATTRRAMAPAELIAWQQDEFVRGPSLQSFEGFAGAGLYHVEMFVALADRRAALVKEREMENVYLKAVGRPPNAIFSRELGAEWDVFTIGGYRHWKHFAERDDIPPERAAAAAKTAGFESDDRIGPYLRSLINTHHDSLVTPVK